MGLGYFGTGGFRIYGDSAYWDKPLCIQIPRGGLVAKLLSIIIVMFLILSLVAADDPPVRLKQTIYSVLAYNGRDFSPTFCREQSETIYLLADNSSVYAG